MARTGILRAFGFPLMVLLIGLASTALVTIYVRKAFDAEDVERFHLAAERLEDNIRERLETYLAMLRAGAGLLDASERTTREEFHAFVRRLDLPHRYPGVQGIGYTERIAPAALPRYEALRRIEQPTFRVWPVTPRDEYHAIAFLEPMDARNTVAIGYDMFTEPTRRAAMEQARDTAQPAASGAVRLVQEIDEDVQAGFLIYTPVYEGAAVPDDIPTRRVRLRGFVYSPFRAGDLFTGILGRDPRPRVGFELFDGLPEDGELLYRTTGTPGDDRFSTLRSFDVAGRRWTARVFSTPVFDRTAGTSLLRAAVWGGVGVTLLLTTIAGVQAWARRRAELSEVAAEETSHRYQQVAAEAERVSRLKDEFLATLSHELRTPLNAVIGWSHMLVAGKLDPQRHQHALEAVLRNARSQSQLIDDLLDMSRIISGRVRVELALVDAASVARAAIDVLAPTAAARRVEVTYTAPSSPCLVRGDANRLQQVLWNLLSNAIKFTPAGGRVDLRLVRREEDVEITVSDTGCGIDEAFLPYVFDRFRQADGSLTRGHGGLGLGLSIVRSLVELHGGQVHAASEGPNRGSTFTVSLPLVDPQDREAVAWISAPPADLLSSDGALHGRLVLAVDDDEDALALLSEVLRLHGADVHGARSGADALQWLDADDWPVRLIVSDIGMPDMDGYELIRRIRRRRGRHAAQAAAVALTAHVTADDQARAMAAGYDVHVAKPFLPDDLLAACEAVLQAGDATPYNRQISSSRS